MKILPLEKLCDIAPQVTYLPDFDPKPETPWYGVKALWYEGPEYRGKTQRSLPT